MRQKEKAPPMNNHMPTAVGMATPRNLDGLLRDDEREPHECIFTKKAVAF